MAKGDLRLDPKHGVNPAIPRCFYCGDAKNELILAGFRGGSAAPQNAVWDKTPCDKCQGFMAQGVVLMSVRDGETSEDNPYRTGGFCVVTRESIRRIFTEDAVEKVLRAKCAFVEDSTWRHMGLPMLAKDRQRANAERQ